MTLEGLKLHNPSVRMRIHKGPAELTEDILSKQLLQFECGQEKGKPVSFTASFDNHNGIFNVHALYTMRLTMTITFGYPQWTSSPYIATVRKLSTKINRSSTGNRMIYPSSFGTVTLEGYLFHTGSVLETQELASEGQYTFNGMKLSQAVRSIAKKLGYASRRIYVQDTLLDGSPEPVEETIQPAGYQNIRQFLIKKAAERGFEFTSDKSSFHFHAKDLGITNEQTITYFEGPDVLDLEVDGEYGIQMDIVKGNSVFVDKASVVKTGTDSTGSVVSVKLRDKANAKAGNKKLRLGSYLDHKEGITAISNKDRTFALSRLESMVRNKWKATLKLIGNPDIVYFSLIQLQNFGSLIDGSWRVTKYSHVFDTSGYTTTVGMVRQKTAKGKGKGKHKIGSVIGKDGKLAVVFGTTTVSKPKK
jgi:hypothetical protein